MAQVRWLQTSIRYLPHAVSLLVLLLLVIGFVLGGRILDELSSQSRKMAARMAAAEDSLARVEKTLADGKVGEGLAPIKASLDQIKERLAAVGTIKADAEELSLAVAAANKALSRIEAVVNDGATEKRLAAIQDSVDRVSASLGGLDAIKASAGELAASVTTANEALSRIEAGLNDTTTGEQLAAIQETVGQLAADLGDIATQKADIEELAVAIGTANETLSRIETGMKDTATGDRLAAIQDGLSQVVAGLGDIAAVKASTGELAATLGTVNEALTRIETRIKDTPTGERLAAIQESVDQVAAGLSSIGALATDTRVISAAVAAANGALTRLEAAAKGDASEKGLAAIQESVDQVAASLSEIDSLAADTKVISTGIAAANDALSRLETAAKDDSGEKRLAAIQESLAGMSDRLAGLADNPLPQQLLASLGETKEILARLETAIKEGNARQTTGIGDLTTAASGIAATVGRLEGEVGKVAPGLAAAQAALDKANAALAAEKAALAGIAADVGKVADISPTVSQLVTRLDQVTTRLQAVGADIGKVDAAVGKVGPMVADLGKQVSEGNTAVSTKISDLGTQLAAGDGKVSDDVAALGNSVGELSTAVAAIEASASRLEQRLPAGVDLGGSLDGIAGDLARLDQALSAVETRLAAVVGEGGGSVQTQVGEIRKVLADIDNKLPVETRPQLEATMSVYFDIGTTDDGGTLEDLVIPEIGRLARGRTECNLLVAGNADTLGPDSANYELARERTDAVVEKLKAAFAGLPIEEKSWGERHLAVLTGNGIDELLNRRVDISLRCDAE